MQTTTLGRTGVAVSVMGLGCGGHSRLGLAKGETEENAVAIVRRARELGVNFIDTAEAYGTETAVGKAIQGVDRASVVLSTKVGPRKNGEFSTSAAFKERVNGCLERLQTDYIDVLHLHGVQSGDYSYCAEELVPALRDLQTSGKIRFLGITEAFGPDPQHKMMARALEDDCWDVIMAGFNVLNPSARYRVFPATQAKNIGVLCMFAVRRALSQLDALAGLLRDLVAQGVIQAGGFDPADPKTLFGTDDVTPLAYRFCRHEPGVDIVLSGTGNLAHLEANAEAITGPPLEPALLEKLTNVFRNVDSVSGN